MTGFLHELSKEFDYLDASLSSHLDGCKNYVLGFDYKREQLTRYRVVYHITVNDSDRGKITLRAFLLLPISQVG